MPGCITHHTCHASVTHFRPILGNVVEVMRVTSHIIYHAKGTYLPLARISTMIPPFPTLADLVTEGPAQWLSPSLLACKASLSPGEPIITGPMLVLSLQIHW